MNSWQFFIDDMEIQQPEGFTDLVLNLSRDDEWHGIFFNASEITLGFYGAAADYLRDLKKNNGIAATAVFRAVTECGGQMEVAAGNLDFVSYRETRGGRCMVYMPIENTGCLMKFRNNISKPVDVDNSKALDGQTVLPQYNGLAIDLTLPAQELRAAVDGSVQVDYDASNITAFDEIGSNGFIALRPTYATERYNNINQGQLVPDSAYFSTVNEFGVPLSPQLLYDDTIACFPGLFSISGRMKGALSVDVGGLGAPIIGISIVLATWDGTGDFFANYTAIDSVSLYAGGAATYDGTFDQAINMNMALAQGIGLYYFIQIGVATISGNITAVATFDPETFININANKVCPGTTASAYLVNELASRIVESITDGCMVVNSEYYGRTDSQPFAHAQDGCGALRALTSGLKIRKAENPKFFITWDQFFKGLRGIDAVGIGTEAHPTAPALTVLRLEPAKYFYQDRELMKIDLVPDDEITVNEDTHYSAVKIGYDKWEAESVNGLDEFNSKKTFRFTHSAVDKMLDAESNFVAAGYVIETVRQASYSATGAKDTSFDNDAFIICLDRSGYTFQVEQGNIVNGSGMYSPATAYNWRVRPWYNLLRWWPLVAHVYRNMLSTASKLVFSSGEGNLLATGELPIYDGCKLEAGAYSESADVNAQRIADGGQPIFSGDLLSFKYPLTLKQFNELRADPYGYLRVQTGNGGYSRGFIKTIQYNLFEGQADIKLLLKWE